MVNLCFLVVELIFIGTGNAFGIGGRLQSSYVIQGKKRALLDCGHAVLPGLRKSKLSLLDIDMIIISHLHPDHIGGLPQFALENYFVLKKKEKIPVYAPIGLREYIVNLTLALYDSEISVHIDELFEFIEFGANEKIETLNGFIETFPAKHPGNARMQIIQFENKTIAYTGDTEFIKESFDKLMESDIIITEASTVTRKIPNHSTLDELMIYSEMQDKRIYLTHVGQSILDYSDKIEPPFYLSYDGLRVEV